MKTKTFLFPAVLTAGIFIYSCNAGDRNPYNNSITMADSISTVNYAQQESSAGSPKKITASPVSANQNDDGKVANSASVQSFSKDQTENTNPQYQNFLYLMQSSAARPTKLDSTHRFIRTANMRFRVRNVASVSYRIEDLAVKFGGYIADTKLESQLQSNEEKPVSEDSTLQTMRFMVTNSITIRVPVENLDTILKSFVPFIDYLDFRNVNTNDITLDLLANKLAQARIAKFNQRLAFSIDNKSGKLNDVQDAEQSMLNQQENSDNALIENLRKDDQVKYSTITLYLYQPQTIRQELIAREKNIAAYEPCLGNKLGSALSAGWYALRMIIIIIVSLWPLWLIGGIVWIVIRRMLRKKA
ncbi:DUF4349 domain-containing protein [soil metagenome]